MSKVLEALPGDSQRPSVENLRTFARALRGPNWSRAARPCGNNARAAPTPSGVRRTTDRTHSSWSRKATAGESPS